MFVIECSRRFGTTVAENSVRLGKSIPYVGMHLVWGMTLAESAQARANATEADEPLDWLDREHDNLRAILGWSLGEKQAVDTGLRLCTLLANFWCVRGHAREGKRWMETAIAAATASHSPVLAAAHLAASRLVYYLAEIEPMRQHCERSLEIARSVGDELLAEQALNRLALALILLSEFERAHTCLAECLALHETEATCSRWRKRGTDSECWRSPRGTTRTLGRATRPQ